MIDEIRQRVVKIRAEVRGEAARHGWQDLAELIDQSAVVDDDPIRVVVAGETKRGKSRLVNSIVGRPGLSPVDVDVATACWVELRHGERDEAVALIADTRSPAEPVHRDISVLEMERYVALDQITDPVVGVRVRLPSPALEGMVLVDTPGVGGLHAGHSRITLSALGRADALLFVCDSSQPILAPEMAFLAEAARRISAITIAVTKSDLADAEVVADETRRRVAAHPGLAAVPVLTVSAALAERARDVEDPELARRLTELSRMADLTAALRRQAERDSVTLRLMNAARLAGAVCRLLAERAQRWVLEADGYAERERTLTDEIDRLHDLLADRGRIRLMVEQHLGHLLADPAEEFRGRAADVCGRYRIEAERGPAAQLNTLAPRLTADLTAAGAATLEATAEQTRRVMRELVGAVGSHWAGDGLVLPAVLDLSMTAPELSRPALAPTVFRAAEILPRITGLIGGVGALSILTGPGALAACVVVAACAGWWVVRGESEQQRRAELGEWIRSAETESVAVFGREIRRRVSSVRTYAETALVGLVEAEQADLTALRTERAALRLAGDRAREDARRRCDAVRQALGPLAEEADDLLRELSAQHEKTRHEKTRHEKTRH